MNTLTSTFIFAFTVFATVIFAQPEDAKKALHFKLQQLSDNTYGVFVKPEGITPSSRMITGSGQVTIVAPVGFNYSNMENHGGNWVENARVDAPIEANSKSYISFGFVTDFPKINLQASKETLLFTFTTDSAFKGTFGLFDNQVDPFAAPNSYGNNPGNDLGIIDTGAQGGLQYYTYAGNYEGNGMAQAVFTSDKAKAKRIKKDDEELTVLPE